MNRILLLDDSLTIHKVVKLTFASQPDFEVKMARTPQEALELLKSYNPDIVVAYLRFFGNADPSSFQVVRKSCSAVLILAESTEPLAEFQAAGLHNFLRKPFHSEELRQNVTRVLLNKAEALASEEVSDFATPHDEPTQAVALASFPTQNHESLKKDQAPQNSNFSPGAFKNSGDEGRVIGLSATPPPPLPGLRNTVTGIKPAIPQIHPISQAPEANKIPLPPPPPTDEMRKTQVQVPPVPVLKTDPKNVPRPPSVSQQAPQNTAQHLSQPFSLHPPISFSPQTESANEEVTKTKISDNPFHLEHFPEAKTPEITMDLESLEKSYRATLTHSVPAVVLKPRLPEPLPEISFEPQKARPQKSFREIEIDLNDDMPLQLEAVTLHSPPRVPNSQSQAPTPQNQNSSGVRTEDLSTLRKEIEHTIDDVLMRALERAVPAKIEQKIEAEWGTLVATVGGQLRADIPAAFKDSLENELGRIRAESLVTLKSQMQGELKTVIQAWIEKEALKISTQVIREEIQNLLNAAVR